MRNGELEDRSEDVTQNAIQRDKEMKHMKKRISDMKESKRVQQKSIRNFRSNIWTYKVWKLFRIDSRHETSHSGSSVTPKKKKIHSYIPIPVKQQKWKKKILRATRWIEMEQRLDQKPTFQQWLKQRPEDNGILSSQGWGKIHS